MKRALSRLSEMRMASRSRIDQDWIVTPKSKDIRKFAEDTPKIAE